MLTKRELKQFAFQENHATLYHYVKAYEAGHCAFTDAMQRCAVALSEENKRLLALVIDLKSRATTIYTSTNRADKQK